MSESMTPRLILLGGFLGAGKTTLLLRAAEALRARGMSVGMITNDQGSNLVDTALARLHRLPIAEVSGGCFCCRFDDLLAATGTLAARTPQVILAEPVGSCTDLAATVLRPLEAMHAAQFALAPLSVVIDAPRLLHLVSSAGVEQTDDVTYLFLRQIEEADLLLLNKCDLLTSIEQARLEGWLAATLPGRAVLPLCAWRGEGVAAWLDRVMGRDAPVATQPLELDYARYARAEARMGWLNTHGTLPADVIGTARHWAATFLDCLAARLDEAGLSVAHVKLHVSAGTEAIAILKGSIVGPAPSRVVWDLRDMVDAAAGARWLLNARVDAPPSVLRGHVEAILWETAGAVPDPDAIESFQPAPPRPTHRVAMI